MNTPVPTPMKSRFIHNKSGIEEIDLTSNPEPRRPQKHVSELSTI